MNENCCVCMDKLFLPVELLCFDCYKKNSINCSSFSRLCLPCAHSFLQLDIHPDERDFYKRCLYCQNMTYLHRITREKAYRKDFLLMLHDTQQHTCPYCKNYTGTQIMMNHHLEKECPDFFLDCACKNVYKRQDFYFHLFSCPQHQFCQLCQKYILKVGFSDHMKDQHDFIMCVLCKTYVPLDGYTRHIDEFCEERNIICGYCFRNVTHKNHKAHLAAHMDDLVQDIHILNQKYNDLMEKYKTLKELLEPFQNLLA